MSENHGIIVDVDDFTGRIDVLGDLMHVGPCRKSGPMVEESTDMLFPGEITHGPDEESPVGQR
ncbi:hypothetical protein SBI_08520 [Streptomyces bingchenggensis BCW-1]|uniref:Uncharacterized protein n=1 Tax=Streptomyces bingchenggensis (strain BCW-1) TaxID=749414 RepID=D7BU89_STRBB|nr:hypothetical protein SBI_08520 [Streptomyces bingchenggensis BCW-1]